MIRDIRFVYGFSDAVVISAMEKVPRHEFVDVQEAAAYSDAPISIGYGQTMSQPYTVAYMTHLLLGDRDQRTEILRQNNNRSEDRQDDKVGGKIIPTSLSAKDWKVLEVGTGSGYQAAVLAELVSEVYTVEIVPELVRKAKKVLRKLGYKNVHVKKGSGEVGWEKHAPYDAIMITAAIEDKMPKELISQLKVGGVIVVPVGPRNLQVMTRFTKKKNGKLKKEKFDKFVFVPFVREG